MKTGVSDNLILVDTSVWIEYFQKKVDVVERVNALMDEGRVVCLGLIIAELIQGAKDDSGIEAFKDFLNVFPVIKEKDDTWEKAGRLSYRLRKKGKITGLADCYISTMAQENGMEIYTFDHHFKTIALECPLKLTVDK